MKAKQAPVEEGFDNSNKDIHKHQQKEGEKNIATKTQKTKVSQNKNEPRTDTFRKKIPPSENPDLQNGDTTFNHNDVIDMQVIRPVNSANNNKSDSGDDICAADFYKNCNNNLINKNINQNDASTIDLYKKHTSNLTNSFNNNNNNDNFISSDQTNTMISTTAGFVNNGYQESGLSASPPFNKAAATLDEFDMMFDEAGGSSEILQNLNDGRSTRRSAGSKNSKIIKVSNDVENVVKSSTTELTNRDTNHSIVDELNQTATSIRHVQLNENTHRRGGSSSSGGEEWNTTNGNPYWNEETAASAISNLNNNKPPFVDTQRFFRN